MTNKYQALKISNYKITKLWNLLLTFTKLVKFGWKGSIIGLRKKMSLWQIGVQLKMFCFEIKP